MNNFGRVLEPTTNSSLFDPNSVLNLLHNARASDNDFKFPLSLEDLSKGAFSSFTDIFNSDEDNSAYYKGLLSSMIAMLVVLFIWLVLLFLAYGKCCLPCRKISNNKLMCMIILLVFVSTLSFLISFRGNSQIRNGLSTGTDNGNVLIAALEESVVQLSSVGVQQNTFLTASIPQCNFDSSAAAEIDATVIELFLQIADAESTSASSKDVVDKALSLSEDILNVISPIYAAFLAVVFLFLFTLVLGSWLKVKNAHLDEDRKYLPLTNRYALCCVFSFGAVFFTFVWIIAALISPFAFLGSDVCVPEPNQNVQSTLRDELVKQNSSFINFDFCNIDTTKKIEDLTNEEAVGNQVCFYSECRGVSYVLDALDITADIGSLALAYTVAANAPDQACIDAINVVVQTGNDIDTQLQALSNELSCLQLQSTYLSAIDDSLCNNAVSGIAIIFITWTAGSAAMFIAMYLVLNLDSDFIIEAERVKNIRNRRANIREPSQRLHSKKMKVMATIQNSASRNTGAENNDGEDEKSNVTPIVLPKTRPVQVRDSSTEDFKKSNTFDGNDKLPAGYEDVVF